MKNFLLYCLKRLNNFTNEIPTAEEEARTILKYMLFKNDVKRTLSVNDSLQKQLAIGMSEEKRKAIEIVKEIDKAYELDCNYTFKDQFMQIEVYLKSLIWESSKRKLLIETMISDGWKHLGKKRKRTTITNTFSKII